MKNLIALIGAFFAAKNTKFGCLGTIIVFIVVYWLIKKVL
ncbi:hypothetical protein BC748_0477 [Flavobacterium dankookense]|jgi:hypothetical protein|uniref:Uncharacterized protein n=1 Tax=Flavobacterium dankookense TaxID=706186 RepID=A0A4R6QFS6_9FLAO|nr:hypothetical protein BC748_0477 [Flavobacterium dankookense]